MQPADFLFPLGEATSEWGDETMKPAVVMLPSDQQELPP
jgi:hypothetical protein